MKDLYKAQDIDGQLHLEGRYFKVVKTLARSSYAPKFIINDIVELRQFTKLGYARLYTKEGKVGYTCPNMCYALIPLPWYIRLINKVKDWYEVNANIRG